MHWKSVDIDERIHSVLDYHVSCNHYAIQVDIEIINEEMNDVFTAMRAGQLWSQTHFNPNLYVFTDDLETWKSTSMWELERLTRISSW